MHPAKRSAGSVVQNVAGVAGLCAAKRSIRWWVIFCAAMRLRRGQSSFGAFDADRIDDGWVSANLKSKRSWNRVAMREIGCTMEKETKNSNGSREPATITSKVTAVTVDTKGACEITGFSRQRLHKLRADPASGFPEPINVGRSVRWFVTDLMAWLHSMKPSNAPQNARGADKTVALKAASTGKQTTPEKPRSRLLLNPTKVKVVPTVVELAAANQKVQATKLQPGQHLLRRMVDTRDGARNWQYSVFPLVPGKGFVPVKVSPRKIMIPSNIPAAERQQLLARAAAMRSASPARPPVPAAPKGDTNGQKTEVSLTEMKAAYEGEGKSLDDLCKRYRMSKSRVSELLREAGTEMRPSGRKAKPVKP
ncbi:MULTISPECIES: helix-turn-helix transcriptional regulator [unclassified Variovorax]|uniref:helix-turn-helix transcriptional regulator n=1 Tax=unclassified Variovorax TaxID=663243 RepID=UPI003F47A966